MALGRAASFVLALFLAFPSRAAVSRVPAAGPAELRVVMAGALPGLASVDPLAPSPALLPAVAALAPSAPTPTPSLLDARKSAALFARLPDASAGVKAGPAAAPLQVLEAVNATLRDLTPSRLRELPDGDVAALSRVILDGAAGREPRADASAARVLARENWAKVSSMKGLAQETVLNPGHSESHASLVSVRGVPERVSPIDADGIVFRHYTTAEGHDAVVDGRRLLNGLLPYIRLERDFAQRTYSDLAGIFLTLPGVRGDRVGVPAKKFPRYVDLRVPRGLTVLEMEKGLIYLIPLPGRTWDWRENRYRAWATGRGSAEAATTALEVEEKGGLGPRASVPVQIVRTGRVRP